METCNADGLLLKPSKPATPLDLTFQLGYDAAETINLWTSYSDLGSGVILRYVLAIDNSRDITLYPHDLGIGQPKTFVYEYNSSSSVVPDSVSILTHNSPLVIPAAPSPGSNTPRYYRYYIIGPWLPNSWVFLGEPDKIIAGSVTRFPSVLVRPDILLIHMTGQPGETVNAAFVADPSPTGSEAGADPPVTFVYNVHCVLNSDGRGSAACGGDSCRCHTQ